MKDDKELDALIEALGKRIQKQDSKTAMMDLSRYKKMQEAYGILRGLIHETAETSVTYEINEPFKSTGSIMVEGHSIEITNTEWFCKAVALADNFEVYPLVNGKLRMAFTFYNLTKSIE